MKGEFPLAEQKKENKVYVAPESVYVNGYDSPAIEGLAKIKVVGVGGGGCNAVQRMIMSGVQGVEFIAINTDAQALALNSAETRLKIGEKVTRGLGAGADPEKGAMAANESRDELAGLVQDSDMVFVTAGMGGGTGTGAAPVVAGIARQMGILTVGVVSKPFTFEGAVRERNAINGIQELEKNVDALLIVPNDKLLDMDNGDMTVSDAFAHADEVLTYGVAGISDLITVPGVINLDMADVRRVLLDAGICHMGIGRGSGENRASVAVDRAIHSPLLDTTIDGAHRVIINLAGNFKMKELQMAANLIKDAAAPDAEIILGTAQSDALGDDEVMITVIASGFDRITPERGPVRNGMADFMRGGTANARSGENSNNFLGSLNRENAAGTNNAGTSRTMPQRPVTPDLGRTNLEPNVGTHSTYTPLVPENEQPRGVLNRPYSNSTGWARPQGNMPDRRTPRPSSRDSGPRKGGILPWLFNENDDNLE